MTDKELYALTGLVENEWKMCGLSGEEKGDCIYADFAVEVAKLALRAAKLEK